MTHNTTIDDYRDHRDLALATGDLWENNGWMVWSSTPDEHVLLWASPYRLISRPDGPFGVRDVALSQTLLLTAPRDATELTDTPFIEQGWSLADALEPERLAVENDGGSAVWAVGDRRFVADPPEWAVRGAHAGVDLDVELTAMAPAFWFTDPAVSVEESQERWFVQCASARGTIVSGGRTIEVDGQGCHERHVHCGRRYDPARLLSARGVTWHSGGRGDVQILVFTRPSLGRNWSRLILADGVVDLAEGHECRVEETAMWVDPRSRLSVPSAWTVEIEGPSGSVTVSARALARAYYLWPQLAHGATVLYWWLGEADIGYSLADGRSGTLERVPYVVHDNRVLYRDHDNANWAG